MIFLYHRVVADDAPDSRCWSNQTLRLSVFRRHLDWLTRRFTVVSLADYARPHRFSTRRLAALTIDDGLATTLRLLLPELQVRGLSATVFMPTAHFDDHEVYWFAYLDALCFESEYPGIEFADSAFVLSTDVDRRRCRQILGRMAMDHGRPSDVIRTLRERYPLTSELAEAYRSAGPDEVRAFLGSGTMAFGSHSIAHPYLDQLSASAQLDEIAGSKHSLERVTGQPARFFAYPAGAYNLDSISAVRTAGFDAAFACAPHRRAVDRRFEIGRIGVYSPSLPKLIAKTFGAAHVLRAFNLAAG